MAGKKPYKPSKKHLDVAFKLKSKGASNSKIAKALNISISTFKRCMDQFEPSIKKGRDSVDEEQVLQVEDALLRKATGCTVKETVTETIKEKDKGGRVLKVKTKKTRVNDKTFMPDTLACMFFLVNRKPDRWQSINKQTTDSKSSVGMIEKWFEQTQKEYEALGRKT